MKNPFDQKTPVETSEKIAVTVGLATPEDWQNYKNVIIEAFTSHPEAFSEKQLADAVSRTDDQWKAGFSNSENSFAVLAKAGEEAIGAVGARRTRLEGVWFGTSLYLSPKFQIDRFSTVRKMLEETEAELRSRGARKVFLYLKEGEGRERIKKLYERFGFKTGGIPEQQAEGYIYMEKDFGVILK